MEYVRHKLTKKERAERERLEDEKFASKELPRYEPPQVSAFNFELQVTLTRMFSLYSGKRWNNGGKSPIV